MEMEREREADVGREKVVCGERQKRKEKRFRRRKEIRNFAKEKDRKGKKRDIEVG